MATTKYVPPVTPVCSSFVRGDGVSRYADICECGHHESEHYDDMADCTCVVSCADDPPTACSLSGEPHVHPNSYPGDVFGPCPVHPDAPGDH